MTADIKETYAVQQRSNWTPFALERLPLPYSLLIALVAAIMLGEQILEYSLTAPESGNLTARTVTRLLVLPILAVYIMVFLRVLRRWAVLALQQLRPTILVSDQEYSDHVHRMLNSDWRVELSLLAISVAVVVGLFGVLRWELLSVNSSLPKARLAAAFIVAVYVLFGWLLLYQAYCTVRHANALRVLARSPLHINVFDQDNLLPFGRLSLWHALPNIGLILIPLLILGLPTQVGYVLIVLSLAALLDFLLPLWGVHQQIRRAKDRVAASVYQQFESIQDTLLQETEAETEDPGKLNDRIAKLRALRQSIEESPEWPFRNSAAFARAIAVVTSPIWSFILNQLLNTYILPFLEGLMPS